MAQFKIYGHGPFLRENADRISRSLHHAAVDGLGIPESKRFHRFLPLDDGLFVAPEDRSERYVIIECVLFTGRSVATKKVFYQRLLEELGGDPGIDPMDIEMTFLEAPRHDWLIRGRPGDELDLDCKVQT